MSVESYTRDNLVTNTVHLVTAKVLQLESGQSVVRGEALKKGTTGLVALAADTDTPYTVALETIDATAGAENITYARVGSFLASEMTFAAGTIDDFRDKFFTTSLVIEE